MAVMRMVRPWLAFVSLAFLTLPSASAQTSAPARPPAAVAADVRIDGVAYTDARAFFTRYGLAASWVETGRRQRFASSWSKVELEAGRREASVNGLTVFLGEPALPRGSGLMISVIDAERLFAPLLRPPAAPARPLRTIVIDAGHGGTDTGTRNAGLRLDEKELTLDVARRLEKLLAGQEWKIVLSRTEDRYVSLADRAEFATRAGADLFISIHFNAVAGAPGVEGTETYVLTPRHQRSTSSDKRSSEDNEDQVGNAHDAWNAVLGYQVHRSLLTKLGSKDRGLKRARFAVLRLSTCPAVLVEAGYLSNNGEAGRLASVQYRGDIAEALASAVRGYAATIDSARR